MRKYLTIYFLVILLGLGWGACFRTRTIEPPNTGGSAWITPSDYTILLTNLQAAIGNHDVQNYLRCFNQEQLDFQPAASLLNNNEVVWQNWSWQDEQAYFNNMATQLSSLSGNSLSLTEIDLQDVSADSLRYVGNYSLQIFHTDSTLSTLFKGQIQLTVKLNEFNEWEIHRWQDIETSLDSSWSLLKLTYIQ